jgi:hypothetical protein
MFKRSTSNEEIEKIFNSKNYKVCNLIMKGKYRLYVNYICPNNHTGEIRLDCFKSGRRCKECYKNNFVYNVDQVKSFFKKEGYLMLDDTYTNARTHINFMCKSGHHGKILLTHWLKGHRCRECGYLISAEKNRSKNPDRELLKNKQKFAKSLRSNLKRFIDNPLIGDDKNLFEIHKYTSSDFISHIKNHPNYEFACKNNNLSIDHIFPIKAFQDFDLCNIENAWIINGLDNLQPLDRVENSKKNCKYNKEEFIKFLKSKGIFKQN